MDQMKGDTLDLYTGVLSMHSRLK